MHFSDNHNGMSNHEAEQFIKKIPLLRAGLTIAADSCSLIFLNKLHILEIYAGVHSIVLTPEIYNEITCVSDTAKNTDNRALYKKIFSERVMPVSASEAPTIQPQTSMSAADLSLIKAYEQLKPAGILTDDKRVCNYCRTNAIPYINTPMAAFVLLYNRHLSHDQYTAALQALYTMGRYGQFVRNYMEKTYAGYCACTKYMQ